MLDSTKKYRFSWTVRKLTHSGLLLKLPLLLPIIPCHVFDQLMLVNKTVTIVVERVEERVESCVVRVLVLQRSGSALIPLIFRH